MENENQQPQAPSNGGGLKLMTVFIVVLALHVLVIGGVSAYSLLKGNSEPVAQEEKKAETNEATPAATETPAVETTAPVATDTTTASNVAAPETVTPAPVEPVISTTPNISTSAPVASSPMVEATPAPSPSSLGSYTVAKGDTLSKIARTHGMKVADLKALNGMKSDNLKIGQEMKVKGSSFASVATAAPAAPLASTPKATVASVAPAKTHTAGDYVVGKGDTLTKIAKQFNTTASAIMAANKIADATKLKIGMKLNIPSQSRQQAMEQAIPASPLGKSATSADFAMAK
ncbi:MAG: LysM peptidoglycan-binding domain-containing protein [Verrucomicrobiota bacterium]